MKDLRQEIAECLRSCRLQTTAPSTFLHHAGASWLKGEGIPVPATPAPQVRKDIDVKMRPEFEPTWELYNRLQQVIEDGRFTSITEGFHHIVRRAIEHEASRPAKSLPAIKQAVRFRRQDGTLQQSADGVWIPWAMAGAIWNAGHSMSAFADLPCSGGATCCRWHRLHYDPSIHGQRKDALIAGAADLPDVWRAARQQAGRRPFRSRKKEPVPSIPVKEDIIYGPVRRAHMARAWKAHGYIGPMSSWDPENFEAIRQDRHIGPWYVDYGHQFFDDAAIQSRKGYQEVLDMVRIAKSLTPEERRAFEKRIVAVRGKRLQSHEGITTADWAMESKPGILG